MTRERRQQIVFLLLAACSLLLSNCGFHLRGQGDTALPPSLSTMRVEIAGSRKENDPLLLEMQDALRVHGRVNVQDHGDVPKLVLEREATSTATLSVSGTGKAREYGVKYEISFHLLNGAGKEIMSSQTIQLQRDYTFDPLNVIAKETEEEKLRHEMRRDAMYQIVRRLARAAKAF